MNDTQLRMYCLDQARSIIGAAPLQQVLAAADEIYRFLTDSQDGPTLH